MEHIAKVLEVAETFEKDLKGGTGYEGTFFLDLAFSSWSGPVRDKIAKEC